MCGDILKNGIKICILTVGAYPVPATKGGAVENLVEMMAENYQTGDYSCSLDIISVHSDTAKKRAELYPKVNFHFIKYPKAAKKMYKFIKRVWRKLFSVTPTELDSYFLKALRIIRKNKYDAVIVENGMYFIRPLKRYTNIPVIVHFHNGFDTIAAQKPEKLMKDSDMMITVSEFVAENVKSTPECNYPVVTVKNVIDTLQFEENDVIKAKAAQIRREFGFKEDDVVCLFAGRLDPGKGVHLLIDAISKTPENVKLLVVGGTAFSDSVTNEFERRLLESAKHLGDRVKFTGYVDYKSIPWYYHACDIAVFPSQWDEAAGLVVLEAQSCQKPVIISQAGGMPEYVCEDSAIIIDKGDNFVVELADAINELSCNQHLRCQMGKAGLRYASLFDKKGYLDKVLSGITETLNI